MKDNTCLVVLSGGQDSVTCLYWALEQYGPGHVRALGFSYGQRHAAELDCAREICRVEGVPFEVLDMTLISQLNQSALTRPDAEIDGGDYSGPWPNTFVPGRNHLFLSFAAAYAYRYGILDIITGVSQADFSGYPDCRDTFVKALNVALNLAMDVQFNLITPLMRLDKAQVWAMADKLGCYDIIKEKTLTCYRGIIGGGCGECPACILRRKGLEEYERTKSNG